MGRTSLSLILNSARAPISSSGETVLALSNDLEPHFSVSNLIHPVMNLLSYGPSSKIYQRYDPGLSVLMSTRNPYLTFDSAVVAGEGVLSQYRALAQSCSYTDAASYFEYGLVPVLGLAPICIVTQGLTMSQRA